MYCHCDVQCKVGGQKEFSGADVAGLKEAADKLARANSVR